MAKFTKAELQDMSIDELQKLAGKKKLTKAQMIAKLLPKK